MFSHKLVLPNDIICVTYANQQQGANSTEECEVLRNNF